VYNTPGAFIALTGTNASGSGTSAPLDYLTVMEGKEKIDLPVVPCAAP